MSHPHLLPGEEEEEVGGGMPPRMKWLSSTFTSSDCPLSYSISHLCERSLRFLSFGFKFFDFVVCSNQLLLENLTDGPPIKGASINDVHSVTDVSTYSETCYSENPLTVTLGRSQINNYSVKSPSYSDILLRVTLYLCPEGVTVSWELCSGMRTK